MHKPTISPTPGSRDIFLYFWAIGPIFEVGEAMNFKFLDAFEMKGLILHGERDNARNNARCTQARKTTHGVGGQHQDVDRTLRGRVNQNDRGQK